MVDDGVFHAIEHPLNSSLYLRIGHDVEDVHPKFLSTRYQMLGDNCLITGLGFQMALSLNGDNRPVW